MEELITIEDKVKKVLEESKEAREDDMYLYYKYCQKYKNVGAGEFTLIFISKERRNQDGLPAFESVSRARRKIQHDNEYLRPAKKVQEARTNKEADYIRYAIDDSRSTSFKKLIDNET